MILENWISFFIPNLGESYQITPWSVWRVVQSDFSVNLESQVENLLSINKSYISDMEETTNLLGGAR